MAQVLKVDSEGKPFHSMKIYVCKSDEDAREVFDEKKGRIMKPESRTDRDVWGEIPGVSDAFGHTFVGMNGNLVYEFVLYEGAGPATKEDLHRMHQQYVAEKRELDSLIARIMRW